jgi:hypothetical protein
MADGLDVVAIWNEHVGTVVVGLVDGANARCGVIGSAGLRRWNGVRSLIRDADCPASPGTGARFTRAADPARFAPGEHFDRRRTGVGCCMSDNK